MQWVQELDLGIFEVRGSLVLGQERAVVWDSLSHPGDMTPYLPLVGDRDLLVVYSHADWDHVWGTAGLSPQPATIISHAYCAHRFKTDVSDTLAQKQAAEPGQWDDVQLVPVLEQVIPCHGPMGGRELISQTIDYLERLRSGNDFELPAEMTPFYEQTHASNLRWRDE